MTLGCSGGAANKIQITERAGRAPPPGAAAGLYNEGNARHLATSRVACVGHQMGIVSSETGRVRHFAVEGGSGHHHVHGDVYRGEGGADDTCVLVGSPAADQRGLRPGGIVSPLILGWTVDSAASATMPALSSARPAVRLRVRL